MYACNTRMIVWLNLYSKSYNVVPMSNWQTIQLYNDCTSEAGGGEGWDEADAIKAK